jgi:hypothetical protein
MSVPAGLRERIKQETKKQIGEGPKLPQDFMLDPRKPLDASTLRYRIRYAARNNLLMLIRYKDDGFWRYIEPYSFRQGKEGPLLYAYDLNRQGGKAQSIKAFYPNKMHGLAVTNETFIPRWEVEIG